MGHFQIRKDEIGSPMTDQLNMTGSGTFLVSPISKNETQTPIRGSAIVNILGKTHTISLTHKINDSPDPDPSVYKWSYILLNGQSSTAASRREIDTCYRQINCEVNKISYGFNSYASLDTNVNFDEDYPSDGNYQTFNRSVTINSTSYYLLFWFKMYYKPMIENEDGTFSPPTDDDSSAATRIERIPCKPSISPVPSWISGAKILYRIEWDTATDDGSFWYDNWSDFIAAWTQFVNNYRNDTGIYTDLEFSYYIAVTGVDLNMSLALRGSEAIRIDEIADDNGIKHGARPLYAIISQQKGYLEYHAGAIPAAVNNFNSYTNTWVYNSPVASDLETNRLLEFVGTQPGYYLNGSCVYHPEFKVRSSVDAGRGAPTNVYVNSGLPLAARGDGYNYNFQYLGRPFILALYTKSPSGLERISMKPYYQYLDDNNPDRWSGITILGKQLYDSHELDSEGTGLVFRSGQPYLSGVIDGKHYALKLVPLSFKWVNPSNQIMNKYGYDPHGINQVEYFNNGDCAVTINDLSGNNDRALFTEYSNPLMTQHNSMYSVQCRKWELEDSVNTYGYYKYIDSIMFMPVLFTDFYLEEENPIADRGFGRLWFSPNISDSDQNEFVLHQIEISTISLTRI